VEYTDADAPAEDGAGREPQWDKLTEQSVVGSMLLDGRVIDDVTDEMQPSDFFDPKHEIIAIAIVALYNRNEPTDVIATVAELERTGQIRQAGYASYLHSLTSLVVTSANAGYYASLVKAAAVRRRMVEAGTRIVQMGHASEGEPEELLERARVELDAVSSGRRRPVRMIGDTFFDLVSSLEEKPLYSPTPWESLDKLIGGFAPGALYVFAARPGSGKSIAALQIAARLAHEGMVAFSSLEMTELELQTRLVAQYGPVHMTALRNHALTNDDWKRVAEAKQRVEGAPIFIDETAGVNLGHIRSHVRAVSRRGKLSGIVVDYLQLIDGEGKTRQEEVSSVSKGLKQLAKDFHVPVIAAAQLKRATQVGKRKLPDLDDLRESGSIEQDADAVIMLDRDRQKSPDEVTVIVPKNRHGNMGQFRLRWQAEYARLLDRKWTSSPLEGVEV
jgi:replicative DNA helicase